MGRRLYPKRGNGMRSELAPPGKNPATSRPVTVSGTKAWSPVAGANVVLPVLVLLLIGLVGTSHGFLKHVVDHAAHLVTMSLRKLFVGPALSAGAAGVGVAALLAIGRARATVFGHWRQRQRSTGAPDAPRPLHAPRAAFLHAIQGSVARAEDQPYSLILFDIDGFKIVNDRHGAEVADEVLLRVKRGLSDSLPQGADVARFGSDEFLAFLPQTSLNEAFGLAQNALASIGGRSWLLGKAPISVTLSAGVASYPETSQSLRDAISQITSALHEAKDRGRNMVAMAASNRAGLFRLGAEVESALGERRVRPAYQPIVDLRTGRPVAEEGLARILLPGGHILGADQFMGAATDLRLASRIDGCLIEQTLDRCREQSRRGDKRLRFINVSAALLRERRLIEHIALSFTSCEVLGELLGASNPLVVEITERELLREPAAALDALRPLLDLGARLAIDDFGSGYSSFLYLTSLPVSFLKIEMDLLKAARSSQRARSILKGIRNIADDLGILTIAEGIEDEELATIALDLGVDWGQGFYFGRPALEERRAQRSVAAVSY